MVTGVSVNVAITNLVMEAVNRGYDVVLPRDAVCGVPAEYAEAVIDNTLSLLATVTTVDELVAVWESARAWSMRFCQSLMYADARRLGGAHPVAEAVGFDQVSLSDHVFYPDKLESSYPYTDDGPARCSRPRRRGPTCGS